MQTLEQIAQIKKDDPFYDEIGTHWQRRAKKLRERRWRALIIKDMDERARVAREERRSR